MIPFAVEDWQLQCGEVAPAQVVDLREPERFARGHMKGARNIPYTQLQLDGPRLLDPTLSVLVVDPAGARAAEMAMWLRGHGFQAGFLEGGMAAWSGELVRGGEDP